jgi:hypothetical protein
MPATELRAAVERGLADQAKQTAAKTLAGTLAERGGAHTGADLVQHLMTAAR